MKTKILILSLFVAIVSISLWKSQNPEKIDDLILCNAEALAIQEGKDPIYCIGVGSVDCPMGGKVRKVVIGYSLEKY